MYILKNIKEIFDEQSFLRKIIIISIPLLIIVFSFIFISGKRADKKQKITGEEWFDMQSAFMEDISEIADHMDTTVTLYYNGNLSEEAYLEQMKMVKQEMVLFIASYEKTKDSVEVKLGTHKLGSKIGCDSAEKSYYFLKDMIDYCMMQEYSSDKEKLIYMYLAKNNELRNILYNYSAAYTALYGSTYEWGTSTDAENTEE